MRLDGCIHYLQETDLLVAVTTFGHFVCQRSQGEQGEHNLRQDRTFFFYFWRVKSKHQTKQVMYLKKKKKKRGWGEINNHTRNSAVTFFRGLVGHFVPCHWKWHLQLSAMQDRHGPAGADPEINKNAQCWSASPLKPGWESWGCSAWKREGSGETS